MRSPSGSADIIIGENIPLPNDAESAPLVARNLNNGVYGSVSQNTRRDNGQNRNNPEVTNYGNDFDDWNGEPHNEDDAVYDEDHFTTSVSTEPTEALTIADGWETKDEKSIGPETSHRHHKDDYQSGCTCKKILLIALIIVICAIGVVYFNGHTIDKSGGATNIAGSMSRGSNTRNKCSEILTAKAIPFPVVDRCDYSDDASDIIFPKLFHPSLRYYPSAAMSESESEISNDGSDLPKTKGPILNVPFPTGAFWTNLVITPTADRGLSYPIIVYPYGYKWSSTMMQISYPPLRRRKDPISIRDIFNPDMTFTVVETVARRNIIEFDPLSVTLRFYSGNSEAKYYTTDDDDDDLPHWESYLVQGSPYITVTYMNVTPVLTPLSIFKNLICPRDENGNYKDFINESTEETKNGYGVCSIMHTRGAHYTILSGVQFLIGTQENLTWMLFASEPITLIFDRRTRTTITSRDKYQGTLRLALIPPPLDNETSNTRSQNYTSIPLSTSSGVKQLINHSHIYPVRSKLSWDFAHASRKNLSTNEFGQGESGTVGTITFEFETRSMHGSLDSSSNGYSNKENDDLLMLALPHHKEMLSTKMFLDTLDITFHCIKGSMTPVVGNIWSYDESLTNIEFDSANSLQRVAKMDNNTRDTILNQVRQDLTQVLPSLQEDIYGFGKQAARLAQLAHIAFLLQAKPSTIKIDKVNYTDLYKSSDSIGVEAGKLLHGYLTKFLNGENTDKLVYDRNFGGIISHNGLLNKQEDFGNGWYNDHHFHYGYLLYASAIMAKIDPMFVSNYGSHVDAIFYDVLHSPEYQSDMQFFPLVRHKSWFDGHSFASGLFPFSDGKSQESSSEAVNCYYGAYLWSLMRGGLDSVRQTNFAKLMLAMEIRGAKTYWHMEPSSESNDKDDIYAGQYSDPKFESSYMVGNLGMADVTITTWFGTQSLYVHMINFMPITEITRELFDKSYVQKEYKAVIKPIEDNVEMAWRGYTICDRAMIEPTQAWNDALQLKSYLLDSGTSQSQIYFWISTMREFTPPLNTTPSMSESEGSHLMPQNHTVDFCTENQSCNEQGLTGLCCPTMQGIRLECCS